MWFFFFFCFFFTGKRLKGRDRVKERGREAQNKERARKEVRQRYKEGEETER